MRDGGGVQRRTEMRVSEMVEAYWEVMKGGIFGTASELDVMAGGAVALSPAAECERRREASVECMSNNEGRLMLRTK